MPRIPYVTDAEAGDTPLVAAIRTRRGGTLLNLDRQLLHSPTFAEGWNGLLGAVRTKLSVDPKLRELAMCVVAVLNDADYEFIHHAPPWRAAGGTAGQVEAVRAMKNVAPDPSLFDPVELATLELATQMTRAIHVDQDVFDRLLAHLPKDQVVELVGTVAAYNMVSRFLVAIGVEPE